MAKNRRDCPALGETITSARCGEERGVLIACTDTCVHNPFALQNYDDFAEIERRVFEKTMTRFRKVGGGPALERLTRVSSKFGDDQFVMQGECHRAFHREPLDDGHTLYEKWETAGLEGLNNDEKRVCRQVAAARLALLEAHRQVGEYVVEVVDLLDPEPVPILVADRAFARQWLRFRTLLAWIYETPHFHRSNGNALVMAGMGNMNPAETLEAIVVHLGGPPRLSEAREWLTDHLPEFRECLASCRAAIKEAMYRDFDARAGLTSDDPGDQTQASREESYDASLVPPALLVKPRIIEI